MRLLKALLATTALALLGACGPVQSTSALIDADVALEAARAAGAPAAAAYEYTSAETWLHKARETQGRADYEASTRYARKAAELAAAARKKAQENSGRVESP